MSVNKEKYDHESVENASKEILKAIGEDIFREGISETPSRFAKAYQFLTSGYHLNMEEVVNGAIFKESAEDMIIVKDIELYSLCEHHLLPFFGKAHVAYLPNEKIIGISKIPRIVDLYSRRLQVQERLTQQIAYALQKMVQPRGVAVVIEAQHLCMMMRGVEKQNSKLITSTMLDEFRNSQSTRMEFLNLINRN